jgi:ribosomal protein S18 acetylase RimI-like enzyme
VREICSLDYNPQQIEAWVGARKPRDYLKARARGEQFWVIEVDGTIAGFSGWLGKNILGFYMHPEFAGRGLGERLFKTVEKDYRLRSRFKYCVITATLTARDFYRKMGFKDFQRINHTFRRGGRTAAWRMKKSYK